ncbi:MAG: helical backbone metal receptor [Lautropia sp.]|nr:helical backbone metal receptor [Lautropia sp.]
MTQHTFSFSLGRRRLMEIAASSLLLNPGVVRLAWAKAEPAVTRVVSLGGSLTEIIYALGAGGLLVGTDASSLYPAQARQLPQVGYYRAVSVEGVASLKPDLIIAAAESGPPQALEGLRRLGLRLELLPLTPALPDLQSRIAKVGALLGHADAASALIERIRQQVASATRVKRPARVLVISTHAGRLQGAGRHTAADSLLQLLGAVNLLADSHQGYQSVSAEAIAALQPDAIVTSQLSVREGGVNTLLARPGIASTPAARNRHVVVLDDLLLLGFGPRVGEALQQLGDGLAEVAPPQGFAQVSRTIR